MTEVLTGYSVRHILSVRYKSMLIGVAQLTII